MAVVVTAGALPVAAAEHHQSRPGSAEPPDPYFPELGNRGYDVARYDLGLRYEPSTGELHGDTRITASTTELLRRFHLDLVGMDVASVTVDGRPAKVRRAGSELVVRPRVPIPKSADFRVRVRYSGTPGTGTFPGIGARNGWLRTDDGVVTLNEPDGARTWFPANDHPSDKASYTYRVDVPTPLAAVANGALRSREEHGSRTTWTWDQPAPMATYLTQLAIGDYTIEDAAPAGNVAIRNAFAPGVRAAAALAAARTPEMMAFLSSWFGPFPFTTYGVLAADSGLSGLAFEAQTFSVFAPQVFSDPGQASTILAHEMAHQWFGDWVSPASWDDTWLNEGFATYADWLWSDAALGVPLHRNAESAYSSAAADPGRAAHDPGRDAMFSRAVYERGALTLHALRSTVGDEAFARTLRMYLDRFGGKTASTKDFIAVASDVAGHDMSAFFADWLGPGAPPPLPAGGSVAGSTAPAPLAV
jgi:aminopeptidase N